MSSSSGQSRSVALPRPARGERRVVGLNGREVCLADVDGEVYAFDNHCPHAGNPLCEGDVVGRTLVCAFHGWRFDLETGACVAGDEELRVYAVEPDGDEVRVFIA